MVRVAFIFSLLLLLVTVARADTPATGAGGVALWVEVVLSQNAMATGLPPPSGQSVGTLDQAFGVPAQLFVDGSGQPTFYATVQMYQGTSQSSGAATSVGVATVDIHPYASVPYAEIGFAGKTRTRNLSFGAGAYLNGAYSTAGALQDYSDGGWSPSAAGFTYSGSFGPTVWAQSSLDCAVIPSPYGNPATSQPTSQPMPTTAPDTPDGASTGSDSLTWTPDPQLQGGSYTLHAVQLRTGGGGGGGGSSTGYMFDATWWHSCDEYAPTSTAFLGMCTLTGFSLVWNEFRKSG